MTRDAARAVLAAAGLRPIDPEADAALLRSLSPVVAPVLAAWAARQRDDGRAGAA